MKKPTAILDKSFFQELCGLEEESRKALWNLLVSKVQLVFPTILLEELFASLKSPHNHPEPVLLMGGLLFSNQACWMDDLNEICFRELVLNKKIKDIPRVSTIFRKRLLELSLTNAEFWQWVKDRKIALKEAKHRWKQGHADYLAVGGAKHADEIAFLNHAQKSFSIALGSAPLRLDLLENVLGEHFRRFHAASQKKIDSAFAKFNEKSFTRFPFCVKVLFVRHLYWLGPASEIGRNGAKFLKLDPNNFGDEQYVAASLMCDLLLTRDAQMAKVGALLTRGKFWPKGEVAYFDPGGDFLQQVQAFLDRI